MRQTVRPPRFGAVALASVPPYCAAPPALPDPVGGLVQSAAANCTRPPTGSGSAGGAAQYGGTLAKATAPNRGGRTVCRIVVLVPGKDGQRPKRVQVDVPAG